MSAVARVLDVAFHRNGVGGAGFHVVLFKPAPDLDDRWHGDDVFMAVVFDAPGHVAVMRLSHRPQGEDDDPKGLADEEIHANKWRGEHFERELRDAIDAHTMRQVETQAERAAARATRHLRRKGR
jgi:hypothetical protein